MSTAADKTDGPRSRWLKAASVREYGIIGSFAALTVILAVSSPAFLRPTNIASILDQAAPAGIMAAGATLVFIAGGFDLSIGAIFALAGVTAASLSGTVGPVIAIVLGGLIGLVLGLFNGLIATVGRINAFIATLGSQILFRGLALVLTGGTLIIVADRTFSELGRGRVVGISWAVWIWLAIVVIATFVLTKTTYGRYVFATGGNPEAARLAGVRVDLIKGSTFVISGVTASIAGVIVASRVATGQADAGMGMEVTVIAGVVIGGISIFGGEGAVWRSVLGVLILTMISNGFDLLNIDAVYSQVFQGAIILLAVGIDAFSKRKR
jgi:ribose transport system permease protein